MTYLYKLFFLTLVATNVAIAKEEVEQLALVCVESIPDGGNPANYTICREHPNGHNLPEFRDEAAAAITILEADEGKRDHPLGRDPDERDIVPEDSGSTSPANALIQPSSKELQGRACWKGKGFGCSKDQWCYARCNPPGEKNEGQWCWLAQDRGNGHWASCSEDKQCDFRKFSSLRCGGKCSCY
ncbi:hypothetical protein BKA66DRAFT_473432 [Pyrenochaeta sp. MPI-SDFR-AT-0127]|nr:hypothetical protein BKA66DRAFT_473432 [Pyrenochaeta sp. MPI-SDFR-AT-0127]